MLVLEIKLMEPLILHNNYLYSVVMYVHLGVVVSVAFSRIDIAQFCSCHLRTRLNNGRKRRMLVNPMVCTDIE